MQDGLPYALIIDRLGEDGKCLRPANISEWKKRGYQDWLIERRAIVRNVDDILGLPCLDDPDPETAQPSTPG